MATPKALKDSLLKQLDDKGAKIEPFISLVDDYMWYWEQEKAMQNDIKTRGSMITATSAAGNEYDKENPGIKNAMMYNKQKLAILKELGLNTSSVVIEDDEL